MNRITDLDASYRSRAVRPPMTRIEPSSSGTTVAPVLPTGILGSLDQVRVAGSYRRATRMMGVCDSTSRPPPPATRTLPSTSLATTAPPRSRPDEDHLRSRGPLSQTLTNARSISDQALVLGSNR